MALVDLNNLRGVDDLSGDGVKISKGAELVGHRLERLLFTEEFGYLGKPEIGSLIPKSMYNPMSQEDVLDLIDEVEFLIKNGEPDLLLTEINAQIISLDQEKTGLVIQIKGEVQDSGQKFNVEFFKIREKNNVFVQQTT